MCQPGLTANQKVVARGHWLFIIIKNLIFSLEAATRPHDRCKASFFVYVNHLRSIHLVLLRGPLFCVQISSVQAFRH
jgi:hypothetical protein